MKVVYTKEPQTDYIDAALRTIFEIHMKRPPGDILVFLPGWSLPPALSHPRLTPCPQKGQEDIENLSSSINLYLPDLEKTSAKSSVRAIFILALLRI